MILTRTPYRVSLFGGGTDFPEWFTLHGGAVLATTINHSCYISARRLPPFFPHRTRVVWSKVELVKEVSEIEHPAVREALRMLDLDGVEIHHHGDLPARSGIGSSSAFAVGLLHALHTLAGAAVPTDRLAEEAIDLERDRLGESVGCQDQVVCALGGFRLVEFPADGPWRSEPVVLPREVLRAFEERLMLFFTGVQRDSSDLSREVVRRMNARALGRIQEMPTQALGLLQVGALDDVGALLDEAWWRKRDLAEGVSRPELDDLYARARQAGAIGGKLLGAGGGGFLLLYVPLREHGRLLRALDGLVHVPFRFEAEGTRVIYHAADDRA